MHENQHFFHSIKFIAMIKNILPDAAFDIYSQYLGDDKNACEMNYLGEFNSSDACIEYIKNNADILALFQFAGIEVNSDSLMQMQNFYWMYH